MSGSRENSPGSPKSSPPAIEVDSSAAKKPANVDIGASQEPAGGIEPLQTAGDEGKLEPRTPIRNRPVSVGMSPKSPAPEAVVTQVARDIESQLDKLEETLTAYETDLTKRLDQIVNRLKD